MSEKAKIIEFIKKSPKAELHLHIEGTLEPSHLFKLAKKNNIKIPFSNVGEIKNSIEKIFKVKVLKVNTLILRGKLKSFKGSLGYRKDQKKAIITLADGNTIDSSLEIK